MDHPMIVPNSPREPLHERRRGRIIPLPRIFYIDVADLWRRLRSWLAAA